MDDWVQAHDDNGGGKMIDYRKYCQTQRLTTQVDESEETEVKKDIEWLRDEINNLYEDYIMSDWNSAVGACEDLVNQLDEPEVNSQIDKLANFIMSEVEGEPSQSQGAVDTAIRIIRSYQNQDRNIEKLHKPTKYEPLYYAKIRGWELIENSKAMYWNYYEKADAVFISDSENTNKFKAILTKPEWAELGITDENADFERVEE